MTLNWTTEATPHQILGQAKLSHNIGAHSFRATTEAKNQCQVAKVHTS